MSSPMFSMSPESAVSRGSIVTKTALTATAVAVTAVSLLQLPQPSEAVTPAATKKVKTTPVLPAKVTVGYSTRGRAIVAKRQGNPTGGKVILLVGQMHGNEKKGISVVQKIRNTKISTKGAVQIWTIESMNPDGRAANRRYNARGVDLNRNFPVGWRKGTLAAGRGPASEKETKAMMAFIDRLRPDAVVMYHQDWNMVLGSCNWKTGKVATKFADLSGLPTDGCRRAFTGVMGGWFNSTYPGWMLTVELPSSRRITTKKLNRYASGAIKMASLVVDTNPAPKPTPTPTPTPTESESPTDDPSPSDDPSSSESPTSEDSVFGVPAPR